MTDIKYITALDFNETKLNFDGFSIIECITENNALLKTMESILFRLKNSMPFPIEHLRIDCKINPFIVDQFYVTQEPSYLFFFNGNFIDRIDGIVSFAELSLKMNQHIESLALHIQK